MDELKEIKIGNTKIIALKDGELNLPKEVLVNLSKEIENNLDAPPQLLLKPNFFLLESSS